MIFSKTIVMHPVGQSIKPAAFLHGSAALVSRGVHILGTCVLFAASSLFAASPTSDVTGNPDTEKTPPSDGVQISELCFVGQYRTKIIPEQIRIFAAPEKGYITHLINPGSKVAKGTVLGKMNQDELALEKEEMEMNLLKDKIAKQDEIIKNEREKKEILFMMNVPSTEKKWIKEDNVKRGDNQVIQSLDDKINLAKLEMKVSAKKKRAEFEKKEAAYTFTMPFDGRVQYQFTLPENMENATQYIENGKEIAVACDDSNFYISISIANPEITRINPNNLAIQVELSTGDIMEGTYSHKRVEKNQNGPGDILAFFFRIPAKNHNEAYEMIGTNPVAKLYYKAEQNVEILNKIELASRPEAKDTASWQDILNKVMPSYEIVLVGETQIIVRKK